MTNEQYESLRSHILELKAEMEALKLKVDKQSETATERFMLLYEWCAPAEYKQSISTTVSDPSEPLADFLNRIKK